MSSSVSVKVTNNQTGKSATNGIPVNGRQQTIAAVFGSSFPDNKVVASVIEVQKPAEAVGVTIITGPANGPYQTVRGDGTPLKVNNGAELDISSWVIAAIRQ
ncbi:hypothetical protein EPUS_03760 [Endocarpon pusillum Z07020]|uniref:Uncharacterized protein n=1 Tax=Endocarpon pusillum (strain Z07020 / HMAS-L-300199) TaxID=1263415 RepID=U1FUG2_ENDPU|nr:uncharacterized protein EPUS_03760 [Endocarpon pusillum Z07020]ERF68442.1 hypothetical protein EPUS_03760 [Endocarpon pusillum Z07020]